MKPYVNFKMCIKNLLIPECFKELSPDCPIKINCAGL